MNKVLAAAVWRKEENDLGTAKSVINKLLSAYREVAKQDDSSPMMDNTQQIYAGLTYGKRQLNETCISADEGKRGYRA